MSLPLSDTVSISITQDSVGVARAGFGVPMLLSAYASFSERIRYYASLAEVAADFAVTTSPEYLFAIACFSQEPKPELIAIGRSALPPTLAYSLVATARNSHDYLIAVKGKGVTTTDCEVTSDAAATVAEVHNAMKTALNAVVGKNYTAAFTPLVNPDDVFVAEADDEIMTAVAHGLQTGDGPFWVAASGGGAALPTGLSASTDYWVIRISADTFYFASSLANALAGTNLTITTDGVGTLTLSDTADTKRPSDPLLVTATAAGDWFSLELDPADWTSTMTHADPGVATDLAAIALESDDWYALTTCYNSELYVKAAAAWIETQKKIYVFDTSDTESLATSTGAAGLLDDLMTLAYARTSGNYHPSAADFMSAAELGACLPYTPGEETWKFKTLAGVSPVTLTSTQRGNLRDRNANCYETSRGVNMTWDGKTADGNYIDTRRGLDWLDDDMSARIYEVLIGLPKVPFTDEGIAIIENAMRASLKQAARQGIIIPAGETDGWTVTVPLAADVSVADKAARNLPDLKFAATLQGAVHSADVSGVVSL